MLGRTIKFCYLIILLSFLFFSCRKNANENYPNEFIPVQIDDSPKVRLETYLLSSSNQFSFNVSKADSMHVPVLLIHATGDYSASAIYSSGHTLFTIANTTGSFNGFDLTNNALLFSKPSGFSTVPAFQNLFLADDIVYVSYYNGNIKGYDKTGSQKYEVLQSGYFIPDVLFKNEQYFFSEIYYSTLHENKLGVYYHVSGATKQECVLDMDIKNMFTLDDNHLLLFGNDTISEKGKIEIYNETGNGTILLHTIPTGLLKNVVQVDRTHYFVSHSGGIYLYSFSLNGLTPFVTGLPVYSLTYDDVDQELFACCGNVVRVYNSSTGVFQYNINTVDSVMDVRLLYNK